MKKVIGRKSSMTPPAPLTQAEKKDAQDETFKYLEKIVSAGSNIDALKIFYAAKDGIESSTQIIKELGLTQKRYYTNLKRLIDVGLVEKTDGKYMHTTLGKIAYQLLEAFKGALEQKDKLDLIDKLLKAKSLSMEETEEIMRVILKDANIVPAERLTDILGPVRMADTWDKVVKDVVEYIDNATESIYFATQYVDLRTIDAIFRAGQRGVKLNFISREEGQISAGLKLFSKIALAHPHYFKILFQIMNSPNFRIRYADVPYTFIVIDRKIVMVEVVKPSSRKFFVSFFFHNPRLAKKLIESFEELYEEGRDIKSLIMRLIGKADG